MTTRLWTRTAAAIAGGIALASTVPVLPAVSQESPPRIVEVELADTATLAARGAAVLVPVEITCPPDGDFAFLSVQLTQRVGNEIARGFGFAEVDCDGSPQIVTVAVTPDTGSRPFRQGIAFAVAELSVCFEFECVTDRDEEVITIIKPHPRGGR